jgi:hypothetical protein
MPKPLLYRVADEAAQIIIDFADVRTRAADRLPPPEVEARIRRLADDNDLDVDDVLSAALRVVVSRIPAADKPRAAAALNGHLGNRTMRRRLASVKVEYTDQDGTRRVNRFNGSAAAQRFFVRMSAEGRDPRIVSAELNGEKGGGRG